MRRNFNSKEFNDKYYYDGELGAIYNKEETIFRVWSPDCLLYTSDAADEFRTV